MHRDVYDVVVVGGGFFGANLALEARRYRRHVLLVEAEHALMQRASYNNQARVHQGYHYPRSLLTAERSRASFARFVETYRDCIVDDFLKLYAIARRRSKVSAAQFFRVCERVGAPIEEVPASIQRLFDSREIEHVYKVQEYAFDATKLRTLVEAQLRAAEVEILYNSEVTQIVPGEPMGVDIVESTQPSRRIQATWAFNATYANLNQLLNPAQFERIPLKHELAEIALVQPPPPLDRLGITVMDGPFFSCMPFPCANAHSFTHVRYTPHHTWADTNDAEIRRSRLSSLEASLHPTLFEHMLRDAARFVPALAETRYLRSLWEVKTLLPQSERDDSRPILFHQDPRNPHMVSALGAKIDNVLDLAQSVRSLFN